MRTPPNAMVTRVVAARPRPLATGTRGVEARATVDAGTERFELVYRVSQGPVSETATPFVAASLLPAMRIGRRLSVEGTVSPRVLGAIPAIEGVMSSWFSRVDSIEVSAQPAREPRGTGVACFFSGGVDSFYSVLSHLDEITALVFVHGFDIQPRNLELRARISESLRNAASQLGKPLIEVETNLRAFADRFAMWSEEYHGSALASVALLLSPQFARFYIPASFSPGYSAPWGSHKDLDPLWSSDATEVIHDGGEASRVDKARLIARSDVALGSLRVCWENRGGRYNCGRCEKCIRTMVNLQVVGALERCQTFGNRLNLNAVAHMPIPEDGARFFMEENLQAARLAGQEELARAIESSLGRRQGGIVERLRQGDLRHRVGKRIHRSLSRIPPYNWELSDIRLVQ
jgi:7-cyano-7-deazaguanine synthase in queuosine biosynthesis